MSRPAGGMVLTAALLLCACRPQMEPPAQAGVCWWMTFASKDRRDFVPVGHDVRNLESCAARLEAVRMREGRDAIGYYQGWFVFASEAQISSADRLDGRRYWVFEAGERRKLQRAITELMARESARSRPPAPGASG